MVDYGKIDLSKTSRRLPSNYEAGLRSYGHSSKMGLEADTLHSFSTTGHLTPRELQSQLIEIGHSINLRETRDILDNLEKSGSVVRSRINNRIEYKISQRGEDRIDYLEDYESFDVHESKSPSDQSYLNRPYG